MLICSAVNMFVSTIVYRRGLWKFHTDLALLTENLLSLQITLAMRYKRSMTRLDRVALIS